MLVLSRAVGQRLIFESLGTIEVLEANTSTNHVNLRLDFPGKTIEDKEDKEYQIGKDILVKILGFHPYYPNTIKIGVNAPMSVRIDREERKKLREHFDTENKALSLEDAIIPFRELPHPFKGKTDKRSIEVTT
jgi:sRNA-binding carbon storage regulator CsrA